MARRKKNQFVVRTQEEIDNIPVGYEEEIVIEQDMPGPAVLNVKHKYDKIKIRGKACVQLNWSSKAEVYDEAEVFLYDNSSAILYDNSHGEFYDNSTGTAKDHSTFYNDSTFGICDERKPARTRKKKSVEPEKPTKKNTTKKADSSKKSKSVSTTKKTGTSKKSTKAKERR